MVKSEKLNVNGIVMKYCSFGCGERILAVLPGLSLDDVTDMGAALKNIYRKYLSDYTVYVFDRRENVPKDYSIKSMADDTYAVMEYLGIKSADIIGISQGGNIAMYLGIYHSNIVNKLAIGSSSYYISRNAENILNSWIELAKAKNIKELYASFIDNIHNKAMAELIKPIVLKKLRDYSDEEINRFITVAGSFKTLDIENEISKIKCPMLVIAAKGDVVFGTEPAYRLSEKTGCELFIYGNEYGHAVYDEAPDYYGRIYDFFINKQ